MCWFYRDEPWSGGFEPMAAAPFTALIGKPRELAAFVGREVIDKYGAEAFLVRSGVSIRSSETDDPDRFILTGHLFTVRKVLWHDAFKPHFFSSGFVRDLCNMLEQENRKERTVFRLVALHATLTTAALEILTYV